MIKTLIFALSISAVSFAQDARVIKLSPDDATKAKQLYEQMASIENQIAILHEKVVEKYLRESDKSFREGWGGSFVYSRDFEYIVPPQVVEPRYGLGNCGITLTGDTMLPGFYAPGMK